MGAINCIHGELCKYLGRGDVGTCTRTVLSVLTAVPDICAMFCNTTIPAPTAIAMNTIPIMTPATYPILDHSLVVLSLYAFTTTNPRPRKKRKAKNKIAKILNPCLTVSTSTTHPICSGFCTI